MTATYKKHILNFKRPSGTSRGVLNQKETWFISIEENGKKGVGECGILRSLSIDDRPDYEQKLQWTCANISMGKEKLWQELLEFPSIQFGVEMAFRSLEMEDPFVLFPSKFTTGEAVIPINGLVWMGEKEFMKEQIVQKINAGFRCIKLKIGALDFKTELGLLKFIRNEFSSEEIEIRVDANGGFSVPDALEKLKKLSEFELHSIEQPIPQGHAVEMGKLCEASPLPIALDEELIGIFNVTKKEELLHIIKPDYLIFKPSLIGGITGTQEWITLCENNAVKWWITSALESNVGLNALAQFTFTLNNKLPQGLGTGSLYINNIDCPLEVQLGELHYQPNKNWNFKL